MIEGLPVEGLDEIDQQILAELREDGRRSYSEIAGNTGIGAGTVRTRIRQMTERDQITIVAIPNLPKLGVKFHALVGIKVEPGKTHEFAGRLIPEDSITWIGLTVSGYDVLVEVAAKDAEAFGVYREEVLAQLPGFLSAEVFVYWRMLKLGYRWEPSETIPGGTSTKVS